MQTGAELCSSAQPVDQGHDHQLYHEAPPLLVRSSFSPSAPKLNILSKRVLPSPLSFLLSLSFKSCALFQFVHINFSNYLLSLCVGLFRRSFLFFEHLFLHYNTDIMKSVSVLLFTAGLVSAVAVPVQLAERAALQPLPDLEAREFAEDDLEKRGMEFVGLTARQEAPPAEAKPAEGQPAATTTVAAASTTAASAAPSETKAENQGQNGKNGENNNNNNNQDQNKDGNKDKNGQNNNNNQNQDQNKNGNKDQNKGNNNNNKNGNKNGNKNNNNNNNNNDINKIIQQGIQQGNLLQGLFTPSITGIINSMGLGQNVNANVLNGLNFANQIVVLNQVQQLQTLMQLNIIQRQQVVTVISQGFSNNGVNIGK